MTAIVDTFDRANSSTTLGTTSDGLATWSPELGTWGISSNQAYLPTPVTSGSLNVAVVDASEADTTVSVKIAAFGTTGYANAGLVFRYVDSSNYWFVHHDAIYKVDSGAYTNVNSNGFVGLIADGDTLSVTLSGSSIVVKCNGTTIGTFTDSAHSTATKHGLLIYGNTANPANSRLDDFSVGSAVAPTHLPSTATDLDLTGAAAAPTLSGGVAHLPATGSALDLTGAGALHVTQPLTGWDTEESQAATVDITADATLLVIPTISDSGLVLLKRVSETYPAPTIVDGRPSDWLPTSTVRADWGRPQVIVGGRDVTTIRGATTQIGDTFYSEPFHDEQTSLTFPAVTPFDTASSTDPKVAAVLDGQDGTAPNVALWRVKPDGTRHPSPLFEGIVSGYRHTEDGLVLEVSGPTMVDELARVQPSLIPDAVDIGTLIPAKLNAVRGRRHAKIAPVTTGIKTRDRGTLADSVIDHVQDLLGSATDATTKRQWTIAKLANGGRRYVMHLKDRTTVNWTVRYGQRGIVCDLKRDLRDLPNVIYGYGVAPDGNAWTNWRFPNLHPDASPAYPYTDPSDVITVGTVDGDTDSGTGVTDWQRRMQVAGYDVTPDGSFSTSDRDECKRLQRAAGITVDGIVGPQTWAATFGVGSNVGSFTGAFIMPLAYDPRVMPRKYNADGGDAGPNPLFDPSVLRVEDTVAFGDGVTRAEAIREAQGRIDRYLDDTDGLYGEITLEADPNEGSRFDMRPGQNITVEDFEGRDVLLHIPAAQIRLGGQTRLTVDTQARDALTLDQVRERNDAAKNPAKRPGAMIHRSKLAIDPVTGFDSESGAGRIPRHALYGGLWSVIRIPASFAGRLVKVDVVTESPHSKFVLALFGKPVSPARLVALVGNPLAARTDGYGPFDKNADTLDDEGFIEAFGGPGQAAGYFPGSEGASPSTPLTGRLVDTGGVDYESAQPPWLWVAEYAADSCFISGNLYPAASPVV